MTFAALVSKLNAKKLRTHLESLNLWDPSRRPENVDTSSIALPILPNHVPLREFEDNGSYTVGNITFTISQMALKSSRNVRNRTMKDSVRECVRRLFDKLDLTWDDELYKDLPTKWENIGDLILLDSKCFKRDEWNILMPQLWDELCQTLGCRRLAKKSTIISDDFRSPQVELLKGTNTWVRRTENSVIYSYDLTRSMFSPGNITEKLRIAAFDCKGQTVVDLFAGIGYFTLPYLVHAGALKVYACEWNPNAVEALERNLALNNVRERCVVLPGDNRDTCPVAVADHVNLGLIPSSEMSWLVACRALKPTGGVLHIHANVNSEQYKTTDSVADVTRSTEPRADTDYKYKKCKSKPSWTLWAREVSAKFTDILNELVNERNELWRTSVLHIEHVKSYAPHVDHMVLDLECRH